MLKNNYSCTISAEHCKMPSSTAHHLQKKSIVQRSTSLGLPKGGTGGKGGLESQVQNARSTSLMIGPQRVTRGPV